LSDLYQTGSGVDKDMKLSKYWSQKAKAQGL
jgi:TPR repeat protein